MTSTENSSDHIKCFHELLQKIDTVIIGAGAGLFASAGFTYTGKRFKDNFADFIQKYGFRDMYSGGFSLLPVRKNIGHIGQDMFL